MMKCLAKARFGLKLLSWLLLGLGMQVQANDYAADPKFLAFVDKMVAQHHLSRQQVLNLFAGVERQPKIIELISKPAEKTREWFEYRPIFLNEKQIEQGTVFWNTNRSWLQKAEQRYQVPAEMIVAIIGIETRYGQNKGGFRVLDALSTLAFDYPPRAEFFSSELEALVLLNKDASYLSLAQAKGSYAGAMGYGQFMPSSYRNYAVDFNGDGRIDLLNSVPDAIGSVAHYFQQKGGWQADQPVVFQLVPNKASAAQIQQLDALSNLSLEPKQNLGMFKRLNVTANLQLPSDMPVTLVKLMQADGPEYWLGFNNFYAITRYNHSRLYAMAAWQLSQGLQAAQLKNSR